MTNRYRPMAIAANATSAWRQALFTALQGDEVSPRGKEVREILGYTTRIGMAFPVVTDMLRKLNYRFMFAEAAWILGGRNDVGYLTKFNPHMAQFSDDGEALAGAYGIPFTEQLDFVVRKLKEDRDTRQATMTLWRPNPAPSKDIPCTVALDFKIRDNLLVTQVFMRSSDVWLGLPYDIFAFSMMSYRVIERLHELGGEPVVPGALLITAASSHLYSQHYTVAAEVAKDYVTMELMGDFRSTAPPALYDPALRHLNHPRSLLSWLNWLAEGPKNDRWWGKSAGASHAPVA